MVLTYRICFARVRYGDLKDFCFTFDNLDFAWPKDWLSIKVSGGYSGGVTPVSIPNTEVKPTSADGTWDVGPWESRTLPDY